MLLLSAIQEPFAIDAGVCQALKVPLAAGCWAQGW